MKMFIVLSSVLLLLLSIIQQNHALNSFRFQQQSIINRQSNSILSSLSKTARLYATSTDTPLDNATTTSSSSDVGTSADNDDGSFGGVEFPPPLSTIDGIKRAATFYSTVVPIIANYYGLIGNLKVKELMGKESLDEEDIERLWDVLHQDGAEKLAEVTTELKGFYVKVAQIVSTRQDLFPKQYTDTLSGFTDNLDPMPASLAKAVVEKELLNRNIAQVHRAVLTEDYGGREVAVKIQRPSIESKLLGDVANLKAVSKVFRNIDALPLDYYTVFSELENQLGDEFDFVAEAVAMDRIYNALTRSVDGTELTESPLVLPRPVSGLISKRVLVMDYLEGVPLSRASEEMKKRGIDPDSPEAKLFGRKLLKAAYLLFRQEHSGNWIKLLKALTFCFGRNILETGFFHADPHPGNIFVLDNGDIGLIDFGQVKQISGRSRETLAKVMIALDERVGDDRPEDLEKIGNLALELGVELNENAQEEAAAAVAMWLFDGSTKVLPGGYDLGELSPNSPVKELKSFPQDLVLVGRSSILIKGISDRLGIPWSLAKEWAPIARTVLDINTGKVEPETASKDKRVRFRFVRNTFKNW
eukprot:CAMPEP_0170963742 /NCGR_PEP_ID=MMETSP0735-20130129/39793_1 /TAXON_ID=186038 /ORGANISM="Fragilariopsis kerguelensis, Strain L26-C5" /LENGTH=585 /DNA_ID=CAMNT_0011380537 /DNA_START=36 /DNA_END=1789 /DNA_ORIENTATION=+